MTATKIKKVAKVEADYKNLFIKALKFYNKGKFDNAIRCCNKSLEIEPKQGEVYSLLAVISKQCGKIGDAIYFLKKSVEECPEYIEGYSNLAILFNNCHMFDDAIIYFKKILDIEPNNTYAMCQIAHTLNKIGKIDDSFDFYKNAVKSYSDERFLQSYIESYISLGNIYSSKGKLKESIEYYEKAIANDNENKFPEAYVNLLQNTLYKDGFETWNNLLNSSITKIKNISGEKADLLTSLAIANWIEEKDDESLKNIAESKKIIEKNPNYKNFTYVNTYNNFLEMLILSYKENSVKSVVESNPNEIYFIGDSHSLTCSNKVIDIGSKSYNCNTKFISGCKIGSVACVDVNSSIV